MSNILHRDRQLTVLHLLVEGNSIRSTERITGVQKKTIMRLLVRAGDACRDLLDREMRGLSLRHLQCDEIWTFVLCKQRHIQSEHADNPAIGDQFLYIAFDEFTKLIPSFTIGKRATEVTERFMLDLAGRLAIPLRHPTEDRPLISTDGFAAYPGAVDLAFADRVDYGVLIKDYRESEQPGRYGPPEMVSVERRPIVGNVDPWNLCTSHVERNNLTIRTFLRRFTRLSLGFSKKLENLAAAVALHVAYYNFCRRHRTIRVTPAMAAGVTGTLWSLEDLYNRAMG